MEQLEKLAPQVPGLVALVFVIPMFLKAFANQRRDSQEILKAQIDTFLGYMKEQREHWAREMHDLHDQHLEARKLSRDALDKQMELARETARGNMEMARAITHLSDSVSGCQKR